MDRRRFLLSSASAGIVSVPGLARALAPGQATVAPTPALAAKSRVIVIGGGLAGATVAKYLRLWGDAIDVVLIERERRYLSPIMSSLVLTGQRTMGSLTFGYAALRDKYGVRVIHDDVIDVDPVSAAVTLASGRRLVADRVVMAPGIDFDPVPGLSDPDRMPHAWKGGAQVTLLRQQLAAMPSNGVAVLAIPKVPYRCPPGPYERACLIADWMRVHKPRAKLIVLDANPDIVVEVDNFSQAFFGLHAKVIDYRRSTEVISVDPAQMMVHTTGGTIAADVVNLIPRQRAGALVTRTGLATATEGRFAPVDVLSYASTVPGMAKVHVIGDSSATTQPKAGHIGNQEAKVCADALARILSGGQPDPAPVTNSACFSTITMTQASWLTVVFQYDPATRTMLPALPSFAASTGWNGENFSQMNTWFGALTADTFG